MLMDTLEIEISEYTGVNNTEQLKLLMYNMIKQYLFTIKVGGPLKLWNVCGTACIQVLH